VHTLGCLFGDLTSCTILLSEMRVEWLAQTEPLPLSPTSLPAHPYTPEFDEIFRLICGVDETACEELSSSTGALFPLHPTRLARRCECGDPYACVVSSVEYGRMGDERRSTRVAAGACSLGSEWGCRSYAMDVWRGSGVAKDEVRGDKLLDDLCHQGDHLACKLKLFLHRTP
jgi:hypothetical protein